MEYVDKVFEDLAVDYAKWTSDITEEGSIDSRRCRS